MVDFVRQCEYCRFYSGGQKCTAFPAGIDTAVFAGVISHLVPLPGDGGVQFLPVQSSAFGFAAALKAEQARVPAGGPHGGEFASNKGGTASEIFARGDLPSAPGTAPIKPGYVRLYHQTPEENTRTGCSWTTCTTPRKTTGRSGVPGRVTSMPAKKP